jgi:hypothetical protein
MVIIYSTMISMSFDSRATSRRVADMTTMQIMIIVRVDRRRTQPPP